MHASCMILFLDISYTEPRFFIKSLQDHLLKQSLLKHLATSLILFPRVFLSSSNQQS